MSTGKVVRSGIRYVKPILSTNHQEAKRRVLGLYRAYCREIPMTYIMMHMNKSEAQLRQKIREEILKNKDVTDLRIIDMLVFKGEKRFEELVNLWAQPCHILDSFKETIEPKPKDFLSKFLKSNYD